MKDFKVLKFLDRFQALFEKIGVDYPIMRKILNIKLTLDGRRISTVLSSRRNKKKEEENNDHNNFIKSLGLYIFMGMFLIIFIFMGENYLFQMTFIFSVIMFLLMTSLIADFSSVLLDVKDKEILLSKPVDSKTLNMAKILHILMYMSAITMGIAGPSLIVSIAKHGVVFFIIYLLEIILMALFVIIITALLYLFILKFFSGEKLKDIINYIQIGLAIIISFGYQLVGRIFDLVDIHNMSYNPSLWKYFLPPVWFAAPFELIINRNYEIYIIIYSLLAVLVPILSIIVYIKLIPTFERNLQKLNSAEGQTKDRNKITIFLSKILCRGKEERVFYRFATHMLKNERTFKLKVYPTLGMSAIFPFFMMFSLNRKEFSNVPYTKNYLWMYMAFIMVPAVLLSLRFSGNYKGAWIYQAMPIKNIRQVHKGTIKAAIINLFAPIFALVSVIYLLIYKMSIVDHIIVAGINLLLYIMIIFKLLDEYLPFSEAFEVTDNNQGGVKAIVHMLIMGIFVLLHYGITLISYGTYLYMMIGIVIIKILLSRGNNINEIY